MAEFCGTLLLVVLFLVIFVCPILVLIGNFFEGLASLLERFEQK